MKNDKMERWAWPIGFFRGLVWLYAILAVTPAAAQSPVRGDVPIVLFLLPADSSIPLVSLTRAFEAQFADLDVRLVYAQMAALPEQFADQLLVAETQARDTSALVVLWTDRDPYLCLNLLYHSTEGRHVIHREIKATDARDPTEAIGIIARTAVHTILRTADEPMLSTTETNESTPPEPSGETVRVSVDDQAEPPVGEASPAASPQTTLNMVSLYLVQGYSSELSPAHGAVLGLELGLSSAWRISARYLLLFPLVFEQAEVRGRIERHPLCIDVQRRAVLGRWELGGHFGSCADFLSYRIDHTDDDFTPVTDLTDLQWSIEIGMNVRFLLGQTWGMVATILAEIPLHRRVYTIQNGEIVATVLVDPWPVQPRVSLGFYVELF